MARRKRAAEGEEPAGGGAAKAAKPEVAEPPTPTPRRSRKAAQPAAAPPAPATQHADAGGAGPGASVIEINRAPVLTLWAACVAEREGFAWESALTFGQAIAGRFAQSKGRSIGVYEAPEETPERAARRARDREGTRAVEVFGTKLLARMDEHGRTVAASGGGAVNPAAVEGYLRRAFGGDLERATAALRRLAAAPPLARLRRRGTAYDLYTRFRPHVAPGREGWGKKGLFDLLQVDMLTETLKGEAEEEGDKAAQ